VLIIQKSLNVPDAVVSRKKETEKITEEAEIGSMNLSLFLADVARSFSAT
jgi:hypothetical protein